MSPGRSRSRICDISAAVSTPPIWHMTLPAVPRLLAGQDRALERLEAVLGDHVLGHAHLHAEHHVGILGQRLGGGIHLREIDVVELGHRERRQPGIGDMHERVKPRARLRHDVAAEGREIVGAGIARRHAGGRALVRDRARRPECRSRSHTERHANAGRSGPASRACRRHRARASALSAGMSASSASISPKRMPMSRLPRSDWLGSSTSPPLITRSNLSFGPIAAWTGWERAVSATAPALAKKIATRKGPHFIPPVMFLCADRALAPCSCRQSRKRGRQPVQWRGTGRPAVSLETLRSPRRCRAAARFLQNLLKCFLDFLNEWRPPCRRIDRL